MNYKKSTQRNRVIAAVVIFLLIAVVITFSISASKKYVESRPTPIPTMTPVPTPIPNKELSMLGGGLFASFHGDHIAKNGYDLTSERVSTFDYCSSELLPTADGLAPGSRSALLYFEQACPNNPIIDQMVAFRTYSVLFTRGDVYLPWMIKSELVYEANDGTVGITTENFNRVLQAIIDDETWYAMFSNMGLSISDADRVSNRWMDTQVNINTSAPEDSSGGLSNYFYFASIRASYYGAVEGENVAIDTIDIDQVGLIKNDFLAIWDEQELQNNHSVYFFYEYLDKSYSRGLAFSTESLYVQWWSGLTAEEQEFFSENSPIVPIYPDVTMSNEHLLLALTPEFSDFISLVESDPYFPQASWDLLGMRTPYSAQDIMSSNVPHIRQDVLAIDEPKFAVFEALGALIGR